MGGSQTLPALILGIAILAASFVISSALDAGTEELAGVRTVLAQLQVAFEEAAGPAPSRPAEGGRAGEDDRREVETAGSPALGPQTARVTIVEFSDFQCPYCSRVWDTLQQLREEYPDDVRLVFKHLPLAIHPKARPAHAAAEAAHRQGRFWEMHTAIFENPRDLEPEHFEAYAQELGLDLERFRADAASEDVLARVDADTKEAQALGVSGTPAFFINGRFLVGAQPIEAFKRRIDEELSQG